MSPDSPQMPAVPRITPIRVFYLDNDKRDPLDWDEYIKEHPGCGVELVGMAFENSADLPDRVAESRAEIVLVDLALSTGADWPSIPRRNGLLACQRLKQALPGVTVVAYTQYPHYAKKAKDHGADFYQVKVQNRELIEVIKRIDGGDYQQSRVPDDIVRLELMPDEFSVSITMRGSSEPLDGRIGGVGFALLWYLAEERRKGQAGWMTLEIPKRTESPEPRWRMNNRALWTDVSKRCGSGKQNEFDIVGETVNMWRSYVHKPFNGRLETNLLRTSRLGPLQIGERRSTLLRRDIAPSSIVVIA